MTLSDITLPISYDWGVAHALLFPVALAERLEELHSKYGRADCIPSPVKLTDGRMMLTADILTATDPGGYLCDMWQHADHDVLREAVQVMPWDDVVPLLPTDLDPL
jgi:hypothetical protein